ncbi:MAG: DEAD/DEAH box helicase family protein [Planctomycetes bacterium]|nr:DEAD/DEAH box helicase family protein [Planctomycetota bacterium]
MNSIANGVAQRLSLRSPQRESLEILARLCEILDLQKGGDLVAAMAEVRKHFSDAPAFEDFERTFPSFCFALATGVGKTRLMGAFITYLHRAEHIQHFFVLAPNLTIYDKLIRDFTPNTPKYVFQGISEFATRPPTIITGETYKSGEGIRKGGLFGHEDVHINIFNISKINAEVRGDKAPQIKKLSEYIGESYFEYLSKLDDLVLLMDESHRYRASAGIRAINELQPILGLELTATPQVERGTSAVPFKNVIYGYPLSNAIVDGFVKEPAVATRRDFDAKNYDEAGLERLKLEDGVRIHEDTKVALGVFARESGKHVVKPFMLVIAKDTDHANALLATIESPTFFEGAYKGKAITVHSNQKGDEKDETVKQLIDVESADNPTEIVIHVNMLREGWDVNNLFTIVPLRAANSQTLVEQSIGRGLRLPYGELTGVEAVDTLTIVAHDHFQAIVDYAKRPDSVIRREMKIKYVEDRRLKPIAIQPEIDRQIAGDPPVVPPAAGAPTQPRLFDTEAERRVARVTLEVIREFERLPRSAELQAPEIQRQVTERVAAQLGPAQQSLEGVVETVDVAATVAKTVELRNRLSIDVPRVTVQPKSEVTRRYAAFTLDLTSVRMRPVPHEILIETLQKGEQRHLNSGTGVVAEDRIENYLVRGLADCDDISYDDHSDLLFGLAGQGVAHLRRYLPNEEDVLNVLQYHQDSLVRLIHSQMQSHFEESSVEYEARVGVGFVSHEPSMASMQDSEKVRNFKDPVANASGIRGMAFGGFAKCLYGVQKFDSNPERTMAVVFERDKDVLKWFRPRRADIRIHYSGDDTYEPDFIVEASAAKYIVEVKAEGDLADPVVVAKANAAATWCEHASKHALEYGGKPWSYLLVQDSVVAENKSLAGLAASYTYRVPEPETGDVGSTVEPFRRVTPTDGDLYRTCVPLLSLEAAAGAFGVDREVEVTDWVVPHTRRRIEKGMFVAQVHGRSMEPLIRDGDWCLFIHPVTGTRNGRIVLAQHRGIADPELGGSFTIKRYESSKQADGEQGWQHAEVRLIPENPDFPTIRLTPSAEGEDSVVAAYLEVLRTPI